MLHRGRDLLCTANLNHCRPAVVARGCCTRARLHKGQIASLSTSHVVTGRASPKSSFLLLAAPQTAGYSGDCPSAVHPGHCASALKAKCRAVAVVGVRLHLQVATAWPAYKGAELDCSDVNGPRIALCSCGCPPDGMRGSKHRSAADQAPLDALGGCLGRAALV